MRATAEAFRARLVIFGVVVACAGILMPTLNVFCLFLCLHVAMCTSMPPNGRPLWKVTCYLYMMLLAGNVCAAAATLTFKFDILEVSRFVLWWSALLLCTKTVADAEIGGVLDRV